MMALGSHSCSPWPRGLITRINVITIEAFELRHPRLAWRLLLSARLNLTVGDVYLLHGTTPPPPQGYIDLSKRRVSVEEAQKCEEKYNKGKHVNTILCQVARTEKVDVEELYKNTAWTLEKTFGGPASSYNAFRLAVTEVARLARRRARSERRPAASDTPPRAAAARQQRPPPHLCDSLVPLFLLVVAERGDLRPAQPHGRPEEQGGGPDQEAPNPTAGQNPIRYASCPPPTSRARARALSLSLSLSL